VILFRTLGPLDLRGSDGQELGDILAQPKRVALLAYLALAAPRGPQQRDILLALFWPQHDSEHARNSLSQSIHVLRRSLGSNMLVSRNGDALGLERANLWCDAIEFEKALEAGNVAAAVELYHADLLEGLHIPDAGEFDQWLETERTRLAGRYAKALEALAEQRQATGDVLGAVTWWRRLATREPYNSRVALGLMRALAAAGDPGGAAQHARTHEGLLRQELDIAPDPEVAAFIKQLQAASTRSNERLERTELVSSPLTPERAAGEEALSVPANRYDPAEPARPRRWTAPLAAVLLLLLTATFGAIALRNGGREPPVPLIRSLAVLPLENLSGDSAQQPFTDGLHDLLITELARYPELSVISRTSVLQYKGTKKRLSEIAQELKVEGVVKGAVLREGGRVRITAQLVHAQSDRHVWAQRYERDVRDIFLLQGELAEGIAREVNVAAKPVKRVHHAATGPVDSAPRELYLRELYRRGRQAELSRSLVGVQTAKEAYRQAIEWDSSFALGYAGLAGVYGLMATYGFASSGSALDTARMVARRAVALDSTLPETRTALGVTLGDARQFEAAEREFRAAIRLSPSDAQAHYWYAILLVAMGRGEDALSEIQRVAELDPFAPRGVIAMDKYARYLMTGERPLAKLVARKRSSFLKREPGEPWARSRNAVDLAHLGKCAEARSELQEAQHLAPDNLFMVTNEAMLRWFCGDTQRARALLQRVKRRKDASEHGIRIAVAYALLGEKDSVFAWLERTEWTMTKLTVLRANEWLDPVRSDPRFPELLRRLGLRS
jgi:TolB-like protein/DNA-binding SARP family transcriptional activator/Flp pilus assembly protein TadD